MGTLIFYDKLEESLTISSPDFLFVLDSEITKNISNSTFLFPLYSNCEIQSCFFLINTSVTELCTDQNELKICMTEGFVL